MGNSRKNRAFDKITTRPVKPAWREKTTPFMGMGNVTHAVGGTAQRMQGSAARHAEILGATLGLKPTVARRGSYADNSEGPKGGIKRQMTKKNDGRYNGKL